MEYTFDANGKILDTDKLYTTLDEWHDGDKFEEIVNKVTSIPREQWSVKLQFRLISAYNNLKRFDEARQELRDIQPSCHTPAQKARFFYMNGYICYMEDKEMVALSFYKQGLAVDPENTSKLDLDTEVRECEEYIEKELNKLSELSEKMYNDIKKACSEKPESEKADISEEEFTMYLGYLSAIRKLPGMERGMGFKNYFTKYEGEQKESAHKVLSMFGITDRESMLKFYQNDRGCNLFGMYGDIPPFIAGKPRFDISQLNESGKEAFLNSVEFFKPFNKYLPSAGILAWDLCEKVGFLRLAYSCDIITNSDYCSAMLYISDGARKFFSSFEEYMISLAFGCGVWEFHFSNWNISSAMKYMRNMMPLLLGGDLPYIKWLK